MGTCIHCGKPAGLFRSRHDACEARAQRRQAELLQRKVDLQRQVAAAIVDPTQHEALRALVEKETGAGDLDAHTIRGAIAEGWRRSVERCLEDGILDATEERQLMRLKSAYELTEEDLDVNGAHTRVVHAAVIRDLLNDIVPQRILLDGPVPVNLQKGEKVVWMFPRCHYLEDKTKRELQGASQGASIRVMKGVYYRVGAFKGTPVYTTHRVHVDTGTVVVTDKHIYFTGPQKSFRVPYTKIVAFLPFDDGFGFVRDAQTAKPQVFRTGDGWFAQNLVVNLGRLAGG
ncbi:MAG TPA: hypothetical protein PKE21_11425 [Flavobacteriales bacterium]|nr:hypothetical protein [Flavobacteriales bacterium]HMR28081.1 hypothetical protein [Flavobacteriales bacterium]